LKSSQFGNINNNDWYVFSGLTLTYTFGENHVTVQTKKMNLLENIDTKNLLQTAIIMDGNGRWAKQQGLLRALGMRAEQNL
jgi:undecaprenyl pyrophosphate synthase